MKKIIRNIGHVHPMRSGGEREFLTSVDYAARTYLFPAGKEVAVEADVADYVSSQYAGKGLVIVDRQAEVTEKLGKNLKAARALIPPAPAGPAIPALRRGGVDRPKPIAGTEAIRLARDAAKKAAANLPAAPVPPKAPPAIAVAAAALPPPPPAAPAPAAPKPVVPVQQVKDRIAQARAKAQK